ncbi:helix-turn-helix transcriptional regulator [Pseudofrankia sp. BMG5.37]|uniref:helix-turn-helix domain-containing protein n=1 Tax=Pseudofrankia sp. BMG5.37 TaxID=3050035 RepID=UPI0028950CFE|nr:helix-turn-helix transcriptional regulator [Pseudofrankia sp. BMG5.37]MDT3445120.1 helix-turn-helix transcriptional regulator [Pseudofrankia sp. BMG5.37]
MNSIGEYLRARRELVRPDEVGIPDSGRRRVAGLRRDELALLAGISTEYYTRLEQGSDHHPSAQVLDAIARALRLDTDATAHLHELATPTTARRRRARRSEQVSPSVRQLLNSWPANPAFVQGRFLDVLAANPLMTALSPMYTPGHNILRAAFLDSAVSDLFCDPEVRLENVVSALRASVGPDVDDPQLTDLIGELSLKSADFRRLWARHDVKPHVGTGVHRMQHPQVGELELHYDKFHLAGADRQMLTVYQAEPGSRSAEALTLLATIAADQQHRPVGRATDIDADSASPTQET